MKTTANDPELEAERQELLNRAREIKVERKDWIPTPEELRAIEKQSEMKVKKS